MKYLPIFMGLVPMPLPTGDPGLPVFLWRRELKKLAKTPSPDCVDPVPLGSSFLFGDATYIKNI